MFTLAEITFFAIFAFLLFSFVYEIQRDTSFQKNFLARDVATTLDVVYASPGKLSYVFSYTPFNLSEFTLQLAGEKVKIGDAEGGGERLYWFADQEQDILSIGPAGGLETIIIEKKEGERLGIVQVPIPGGQT